jgi:hypothetical protein
MIRISFDRAALPRRHLRLAKAMIAIFNFKRVKDYEFWNNLAV